MQVLPMPKIYTSTMTETEQNIAIAEFCGWSQIVNTNPMAVMGMWRGYPPVPIIGQKEPLPSYTGDLNAMHEAEKKLSGFQFREYYRHSLNFGRFTPELLHLTAQQKAVAFVHAIGKWKDE
jgi:hypothetical protein